MTTQEYLSYATNFLQKQGIATARLDSLVLMEFVLGIDKARILAEPEAIIASKQTNVLNRLLEKRSGHMPIAYIVNHAEFYGRSFYINDHVLQPRPESETMIELLKQLLANGESRELSKLVSIADIGTGSGVLGITAVLECPNVRVDLIDIDSEALKVAKKNVVLHTIDTKLINDDLLLHNTTPYDILLCNLPYVPDDFRINLAASHEPKIAIFGGKDGLDTYRKLFKILTNRQHAPLYILIESLPPSHEEVIKLAKGAGYNLSESSDFIQVFKFNSLKD